MSKQKESGKGPQEKDRVLTVRTGGLSFLDPKGRVVVLPADKQRKREAGGERAEVRPGDFRTLNYKHYVSKKEAEDDRWQTAELARARLIEFEKGDSSSVAVGVEIEGTLYTRGGDLLTVHGNGVTFDDVPPELFDAQLEVVTGKAESGGYPSTVLEIAQALGTAIATGERIATIRHGLVVFSSVPEGGDSRQIRLTNNPKILSSYERGQTGVTPKAPDEVKDLCDRVGLTDIVPYQGTHVHTSNQQFPDGQFDSKAAYAAAALELTQLSQLESYTLFNTSDYLGVRLDEMRDVRSVIKRANLGAQETNLPDNAYDLVEDSVTALEEGDTHEMSRHPVEGQHDRVRTIKEFGTTESVGGAANPDLRLIMAHAFFKQLMRVLSYEALVATGGDESRVISYLQHDYEDGKYGYLFEQLATKNGENSSFEQDKLFNQNGFDATNGNRSYREQLQAGREIIRSLGNKYPAFQTQARIVDHVFGKIIQVPDVNISLAEYLDPETGMKGGIVSDYKSFNIIDNIRAQAEGTNKQLAMLQAVTTDKMLLEFFGIKE